jgi:hypothetical protein
MRLRHALAAPLLACALPALAQDLNLITGVSVKDEGRTVVLSVTGSRPPNFTTFSMADPPRFVLDLSEARFRGVPEELPVNDGTILTVKNLSYGSDQTSIARVMITFAVDVEPPDVQTQGSILVVRVSKPAPGARAAVAQASAGAQRAAEAEAQAKADAQVRADAEAEARAAAEKADEQERAAADARRKEMKERAAATSGGVAAGATASDAAAEARARAEIEAELRALEQQQAQAQAGLAKAPPAEAALAAEAGKVREDLAPGQDAAAAALAELERKKQEASERKAEAARQKAEAKRQREEAIAAAKAEERRKKEEAAQKKAEAKRQREEAIAAAKAEAERKKQEDAARKAEARRAREEAIAAARPSQVRELGFTQLPGASRVFLRTSAAPRFTIQDAGENLVRVELENARALRRNDLRFLDTSFFQSAVAMITPSRRGSSYVLDIRLKQKVPYQQKLEGDMLAIDFERPAAAPAPGAGTEPAAAEEAAPAAAEQADPAVPAGR